MSKKLFGDDLSEAKKAGQQMQKPYSNSSHGVQCTRKKVILADSSLTIMTRHEALATNQPTPSLFCGMAAHQHRSGKKESASNNNSNNKN